MSLPPGPTASPALQTLAFMLSPQGSMERAAKRYGDLFTVRTLIFGPQVVPRTIFLAPEGGTEVVILS